MALAFLKKKPETVVSLDVMAEEIDVLAFKKAGDTLQITHHETLALPIKNAEERLSTLFSQNACVAIAVSDHAVTTHTLDYDPILTEKEILVQVKHDLPKLTGLTPEEILFDFYKVPPVRRSKFEKTTPSSRSSPSFHTPRPSHVARLSRGMPPFSSPSSRGLTAGSIQLFTLPRVTLEPTRRFLSNHSITPCFIEPTITAIARATSLFISKPDESTIVVNHIDNHWSSALIKNQTVQDMAKGEINHYDVIREWLGKTSLKTIWLTGTHALHHHTIHALEHTLGTSIKIANALQNLTFSSEVETNSLFQKAPLLATSCGLALRSFSQG